MKTQKKIGILLSFFTLLGVSIYYFLNKNNSQNIGDNEIGDNENSKNNNSNSGNVIINGVNYLKENIKKAGYISERKDKNELVVHFALPRPPKDYIKKNNSISLINFKKYNGIYTVKDTWIDDNGNLGAIYLNSNKIENDNEENKEFENKGIIIKI